MSKATFVTAKDLIRQKRYTEARLLLDNLDHPTAKKWLKDLERIAPSQNNSQSTRILESFTNSTIIATLSFMLLITFLIAIYAAFFRPSVVAEAQSEQKWEYLVLSADLGYFTEYEVFTYGEFSIEAENAMELAFDNAEGDWSVLSIYLNALGQEGWILVDTVAMWDNNDAFVNYIFRRSVE